MTENQIKILEALNSNRGYCLNYKAVEAETGLQRDVLEKEVKQLRNIGLVEHVRGLMDEDGRVAGSGFCIPYAKEKEVDEILEKGG